MKILAAVAAIIFLVAGCATAHTNSSNAVPLLGDIPQFRLATNNLSDAEIQGHNLAQQLLEQSPAANFTQNGVLKIRDKERNTTNIPVSFKTQVTGEIWKVAYYESNNCWIIVHQNSQDNRYVFTKKISEEESWPSVSFLHLSGNEIMIPFANSDFWIADLGLEFFHWPEQKILKKENRRSRGCMILESTNPNPSTNGYSRVVSWIDEETLGIVHAEAYDFKNKLLKEFDPKSFKKVNGQWELQEMEIDNVQTGSRTRLEFTGFDATNSVAANPSKK
jgi:Outer membrane lipoprotein-sorting protein